MCRLSLKKFVGSYWAFEGFGVGGFFGPEPLLAPPSPASPLGVKLTARAGEGGEPTSCGGAGVRETCAASNRSP